MDAIEPARETIEHHAQHGAPDRFGRRVAILVAFLAATLAITELAVQSSQTQYVASNIAVSNNWVFYGFKETRARMAEQTVTLLQALPGAPDAARQAGIAQAQAIQKRMRDGSPDGPGTKQIAALAKSETHTRDHALHQYHLYEYAAGTLQMAIVLASVAIVTRSLGFAAVSGGLGLLGTLFGLAVRVGLI